MEIKKKLKKIFITLIVSVFVTLVGFSQPVITNAQTIVEGGFCDFFPCDEYGQPADAENFVENQVEDYIRLGISLVFVGIIAMGIFYIVKAAYKIIRSEGNQDEVEGGYKIIKSVWIGIAMIFIGIVGLIIIIAFFGGGNASVGDGEKPAEELII